MTSYVLVLSDGTFDQFIPEDLAVSTHGLTFTGRGVTEYGEARNENILHMIENFADTVPPASDPLTGQLWWEVGPDELKVWDGFAWVLAALDEYIIGGSYPVTGTYLGDDELIEVTKFVAGAGIDLITNVLRGVDLADHESGALVQHAATAISFTPSGSVSGANVQLAVESVDSNITAHLNDAIAAHIASAISFVPYLSLTGSTVQTAISDADTSRDGVDTEISTQQTLIDNHKADAVDAHDADHISFIPGGSGLVSTDVQAAIDEIQGSSGTPGALETLQARPSGTQQINATFTQILFQTVNHGNTLAQWNTGTSTYTAAFDQEVNITYQLTFVLENQREGFMEIRNGASVIRNSRITNFDNNSDASEVAITQMRELHVKTRLNTGNQVRFYALVNPFNVIQDTQSVSVSCHVQFEIVRVL